MIIIGLDFSLIVSLAELHGTRDFDKSYTLKF